MTIPHVGGMPLKELSMTATTEVWEWMSGGMLIQRLSVVEEKEGGSLSRKKEI